MNPISQDTMLGLDNPWPTPGMSRRCTAEEISNGRHRRVTLRSRLGVVGAGESESLDSVLATLVREGDAFAKWREGGEALTNLQVVRRTRGIVTPVASLHPSCHFRIDLERTEDSQLEVWECGDDMELRFPVLRLPLSNFEDGRVRRITERLRPDVVLSFDIKNEGGCASLAVSVNAPPAIGPAISRIVSLGFAHVRESLSDCVARWSRVGAFLKPAMNAIIGFRSAPLYPWQLHDVRNDPLYRLGVMFRPAMSLQ